MDTSARLQFSSINLWLLKELLNKVVLELPESDRWPRGGYFTAYRQLKSDHTQYEMLGAKVGTINVEKADKYRAFSAEKALRLSLHDDHLSSFQSQDPENNKWPGAVRKDSTSDIFSFSGLPWKADEALVLLYGVEIQLIPARTANEIAKISDNDIYFRLMDPNLLMFTD